MEKLCCFISFNDFWNLQIDGMGFEHFELGLGYH
jgi:hypothetical protein